MEAVAEIEHPKTVSNCIASETKIGPPKNWKISFKHLLQIFYVTHILAKDITILRNSTGDSSSYSRN